MPRETLDALVASHCGGGLLIDSNLLLLFVVGSHDRRLITTFRRTDRYTEADFVLLLRFIARFSKVLTTPNILTEVSNLCGNLRSRIGDTLFRVVQVLDERYCPSRAAIADSRFRTLGLTDGAIAAIAGSGLLVLTDDLPLSYHLAVSGVDVVNFSHVRDLALR